MNKFGQIKSNIESILLESYGKASFKNHMKSFKKNILENKKLSEVYYLYDELTNKKGMGVDIIDDYINESFDIIKDILKSQESKLKEVNMWVSENITKSVNNYYSDIDNVVYNTSVKNLEKVLESKNRIKKNLIEVNNSNSINEIVNLPISSMLKIATNTFNREYENISEEEKNELKQFLSLDKKQLVEEIEKSKLAVLEKLEIKLNESSDPELKEKVNQTINKINESEVTLVSLYKLKQLESGL
jgi:F0F1-type ATP synthase membrane subunit b/b'